MSQTKSNAVVLALNQTAEPDTCGSCKFFDRRGENSDWDQSGRCGFKLPPTRVYQKQVWDGDSQPLDTVRDSDRCDLWKSSGKIFIVSRMVTTPPV